VILGHGCLSHFYCTFKAPCAANKACSVHKFTVAEPTSLVKRATSEPSICFANGNPILEAGRTLRDSLNPVHASTILVECELDLLLLFCLLLDFVEVLFPRARLLKPEELSTLVECLPVIPSFTHKGLSRHDDHDLAIELVNKCLLCDAHCLFELGML
jgi:hypothetical protein